MHTFETLLEQTRRLLTCASNSAWDKHWASRSCPDPLGHVKPLRGLTAPPEHASVQASGGVYAGCMLPCLMSSGASAPLEALVASGDLTASSGGHDSTAAQNGHADLSDINHLLGYVL